MSKLNRYSFLAGLVALPVVGVAQVPDVLSALDAGGRAMGMGGAGNITGADTTSGYLMMTVKATITKTASRQAEVPQRTKFEGGAAKIVRTASLLSSNFSGFIMICCFVGQGQFAIRSLASRFYTDNTGHGIKGDKAKNPLRKRKGFFCWGNR